jgi:N-acetylmuramoyl-L-alanine amidase
VRLFNGHEGWVNATLIDPTVAITSLPVVDSPALTAAAAVNTGALNVRVGPGIGYASSATLSFGTNVQLLGRNNNGSWVKVKLANGHEGWVNATLITANVAISDLPILTAPVLTAMAAVSTGSLNVRSGPGVAYGITAVLDYGVNVQLLGRNNNSTWVKIKLANGHEGWVNAALITPNVTISSLAVMTSSATTAPTAVIGTGSLNVRSGPGVGYAVTSATYLGHTVTMLGRNAAGSWVKIKLANGHEGWVNATYIQPSVAVSSLGVIGVDTAVVPTATIATYALNVRSGPAATYTIVAYYSQWQTAQLVGRNSAGTWVQVQLTNGTGWINAAYIQTNVAISTLPVTG